MSWTTTDDVIDSWVGEGAPADTALVQIWIDRSERFLKSKISDLDSRITSAETDLLEKTQDVVCNMVHRVFRNPSGVRSSQMTTGPFTETVTYSGDKPGALYATEEELASLTYAGNMGQAYTVDMIPTTSFYSPHYEG